MNKQELHQYLLELDREFDPTLESPKEFNYQHKIREVEKVKNQIQLRSKINCSFMNNIQDAYFFAEIAGLVREQQGNKDGFTIRFSKFGRMATYAIQHILRKEEILLIIDDILVSHNFIIVDSEWLFTTPYDGVHQYFLDRKDTWWYRFFDYT